MYCIYFCNCLYAHPIKHKTTDEIYLRRSNKVESNKFVIDQIILKNGNELFVPVFDLCPNFSTILSHMLVIRLGLSAKDVDFKIKMTEWSFSDCQRVGRSMATIMREVQQGDTALEAWRLHYPRLNKLFDDVEGFDAFMLVITNNLLRDSKYGMAMRVSIGAALSTIGK